MLHRTSLRSFALVAVAACLREPSPPTFDDADIATACAELATAECMVRQMCSSNDYNILHVFGSDAACIDRESLTCINNLHVTDTRLSPTGTERCSQSYPNVSCAEFFESAQESACVPASGPGAIGSPCTAPSQCETNFCAVVPNLECGTCQRLPAFGTSCEDANECGPGIDCAIPAGSSTGSCAAYVPNGEPCLTNVVPCDVGYTCVGDDATTGAMGTCMIDGQTVGAPCDNAHQVAPMCNGNAGFYCQSSSKSCQLYELAGFNEACGTVGSAQAQCVGAGLCVKSSGSGFCVPPALDGQMCNATTGPPCLLPAKCVNTDGSGNGVCIVPNPADCF